MKTREISLLLGTGLATQGGKLYASLGHYSDKITDDYWDETWNYSGLQFGIGGGYNWKHLSFDLWLNIKDTTEYEDDFDVEIAAVSAGLGISARF